MGINLDKKDAMSRRQVFPFIGFSLFIPFFGFSNSKDKIAGIDEDKFQTLLKSDGTTVHIKESSLKNAKILKKDISNNSFLNWLGRKL